MGVRVRTADQMVTDYSICGLPVQLIGLPEMDEETKIPFINELHKRIVEAVILTSPRLSADEIKFLCTELVARGTPEQDIAYYSDRLCINEEGVFHSRTDDAVLRVRAVTACELSYSLRHIGLVVMSKLGRERNYPLRFLFGTEDYIRLN